MRTLLLAAAVIAIAAPSNAATRNFAITSFAKVRVDGPYRVRIATGVPSFAKATGSPAALDRVAVEVRGDTLVVHANPSWGGYPGADPGPVDVSVGTHDLTSATLIGAGGIAIDRVKGLSFVLLVSGSGSGEIGDVAADQLNISLAGTASAKLAGRAGKLTALVRGVSALDAAKLTTPNAAISAEGTATIDANVTDTARVDAWGPATIRFTGRPSCTLKVNGSTSVSGCK
jgi:Putative auto-transporter adhesin, head GIN domain